MGARAVCLEHVAFEGPANIARWCTQRGVDLTRVRLDRGDPLPPTDEFDLLIAMGGPMGADQDDRYAWMKSEKVLLREAVATGRAVLGVCLGAQLLAAAHGAGIRRNEHKEIGWFPVDAVDRDATGQIGLPERFVAFHWHGDTFDLPDGAIHLYRSAACHHQAFLLGERAIGLQFHVEATVRSVELLLRHAQNEITGGTFEQAPESMTTPIGRFHAIEPVLFHTLDHLADLELGETWSDLS